MLIFSVFSASAFLVAFKILYINYHHLVQRPTHYRLLHLRLIPHQRFIKHHRLIMLIVLHLSEVHKWKGLNGYASFVSSKHWIFILQHRKMDKRKKCNSTTKIVEEKFSKSRKNKKESKKEEIEKTEEYEYKECLHNCFILCAASLYHTSYLCSI